MTTKVKENRINFNGKMVAGAGSRQTKRTVSNWPRLIQKIYEVNPFTRPMCQGRMCILAFIENSVVIQKILKYFDLQEIKRKPRPITNVYLPLEGSAH